MGTSAEPMIVWMDLEMTGLTPENCRIMEIATIITDYQLELIAEGPELVIQQKASQFASMDDWNQKHHMSSGLWQKAVDSKMTMIDAEHLTLQFLKKHIGAKSAPLAGNTIWQDRRFLCAQMPLLEDYLHYRTIDVSSIKVLVNQWYPKTFQYQGKKEAHRALDDIKESIAELRFYKSIVFKSADQMVPPILP
jgi:oligoribonuclease